MKLTVLLENLVYQSKLQSEHGVSFWIQDDDGVELLFDSGQTDLFAQNASILQTDLSKIDYFVLSHGHYDHSGGLPEFLKLNKKAKLYIGKDAFLPKYHGDEYIGVPKLENIAHRVLSITEPINLSKQITLFPHIDIKNYSDTHFGKLMVCKNNQIEQDSFEEEQFLAIVKGTRLTIVSGCSHRGISNMLATALSHFSGSSIGDISIVGGLHLIDSSEEQIDRFIECLKKFPISKISTCHCTGVEAYHQIKNKMGTMGIEVSYAKTGDEFEL
ncbi:MAG: MBL fold metallo-hydrolase [Oligoflexia bacterium]|nr:MBL fold metallo-hydrolase [Oligoflexia bacterium]